MITRQLLKRYGKAALALALVAGPVAAFATPASAWHESTTIRVGVANDGTTGRAAYDDSDVTGLAGTTFTFSFEFGNHDVTWSSTKNPGGLAHSPGSIAGTRDVVPSTMTRTPTVVGTYVYYCEIHTSDATASAATDFTNPTDMYGRLVITADTLAPVWSNANPVTAVANSASQITVAWPAATDNSGSVFYDVFQNTANVQPGTPVGNNVSGLTYVATGLISGTTYFYWVVPVDAANNAAAARSASVATISVAVSATALAVMNFAVNPTLSIAVTPAVLDLGTLSPAAAGIGTATVTIGSNDVWSLSVKSVGRNGTDEAPGDDAVFTDNGVKTIPVGRATWNAGGGATPLSDVSAVVRTAQPVTTATVVNFAFSLQPLFTDPVAVNYRTTVLYTATQP